MRTLFLFILFISIPYSAFARSVPGVSEDTILLGVSHAQSGPASDLGLGVATGLQVYFDKVNVSGIHGRKILLKIYDDGYEPDRAILNTHKLIHQDSVFALLGYVGTPTSKAVMPTILKTKIPFFAPYTGAGFLRKPVYANVFNMRPSYADETEAIVKYLVEKRGVKKIALFMQDDTYGIAGRNGIIAALSYHDLMLSSFATYTRNTEDISEGLNVILENSPEAVIIVGSYKPAAAFVKAIHAAQFNPIFVNLSFIGSGSFIKEAGDDAEGSFIAQVIPNPFTSSLPIVQQYREDMKEAGHPFSYTSLEGYLQAALFTKALEKAGRDLTRTRLKAALSTLSVDLGGLKSNFLPHTHQGFHRIYLTQIKNGSVVDVPDFE